MDLEPYLALLGLQQERRTKPRARQALRRGIPYTPQAFPPEEASVPRS